MRITKVRKEMPMPGRASIKPDIYVEFENDEWLTVEVIKTSPPTREVHEHCGTHMIVLDLRELEFLNDDRAFSKWIQGGGVEEMLRENASLEVRQRRYEERENEWKRKDEREFRAAVRTKISECQRRFTGIVYTGNEEDFSDLDEIEAWFEEELAKKELRKSIQDAIDANVEKFGETLDRGVDEFSSPEEVNKFYQKRFKKRIEQERAAKIAAKKQLDADIDAAKKALEKELDIKIRKKFETLEEFEHYAEQKRKEREKQMLSNELKPLIQSLEKDCGIRVRRRFKNREEFDNFERRERENHRLIQERTKVDQAIQDEYEEAIQQREEVYRHLIQELFPNFTYNEKWQAIQNHIREIRPLLNRAFVVDDWATPGSSHRMRKGALVLTTDLSRKLDETCEIWSNHVCHEMQSKAAAALLKKMEENLHDPALGMKSKKQLDDENRKAKAERQRKWFERREKQQKREQLRAEEEEKERLDQEKREDKRERDRKRRREARLEAERRKMEKESMMQHRKSERKRRKQGTRRAKPIRGRRSVKPPISVDPQEEE